MIGMNIWGIVFIVIGIIILINTIFGINIPIFRILLALLLLYAGFSLLTSSTRTKTYQYSNASMKSTHVVFNKRSFKNEELSESYQIVFGEGIIDLRKQTIDIPTTLDINITFGSAQLRLNPDVPTLITASASFGKVEFPDNASISMGSQTYRSHPQDIAPVLTIRANVSFGSLEIEKD